MTICIAAACDYYSTDGCKVVIAIDQRISIGGFTSTETGVKGARIWNNWHVMYSGDDVSYVTEVITKTVQQTVGQTPNSPQTAAIVGNILAKSYQDVRRVVVEQRFLSAYSWTMDDFLKRGLRELGSNAHREVLRSITEFNLGFDLLAIGFDVTNGVTKPIPSMLVVDNPGVIVPTNILRFHAIGSGALNAITYLSRWEQHEQRLLETTIYNLIGAKVLAEKAVGIGSETCVMVVHKAKPYQILSRESVLSIRKLWEDTEQTRPDLDGQVRELIKFRVQNST